MSQSGRYIQGSGAAPVETLTGNTGGAVPPTGGNINVVGSAPITVTGNPGTSTLTIDSDGTLAITYTCDVGSATPAADNLNVFGGNGIATSGAGSTITTAMDSPFTGSFTFNQTSPGTAEVLAVAHSDNTAATDSSARVYVGVGGTTQIGDPYINFATGSGRVYAFGSDTSDSQTLKITTDAASNISPSSGTELLTLDSSGNATITGSVTADTFDTSDAADGLTITSNSITADGTNTDIDIDLIPKGDGGTYTDRLKVNYGGSTNNFTINGVSTAADVIACDSGGVTIIEYLANSISNTAATGPRILGARSRDAGGFTPNVVQNNDTLLDIYATGYDGTDFSTSARIGVFVDGTPGNNDMPGRMVFYTSQNGTQNLTEAMRIDSSQNLYLTQYTQNSLNYTGASGIQTEIGPLTDGQLIIGSTGNPPQAATLTAGDGIGITNGAGSITISADNAGFAWSVVTASSETLADNNGYFANNGVQVDFSLPMTAAVGDTFVVAGMNNATGWTISQNAGQTIHFSGSSTTTGVGGSLTSTSTYDVVELVCNVADTDFVVTRSVGNITIV